MSATTVAFISPDEPTPNGSVLPASVVAGKHNPRSFTSPDGVMYELVWVTPAIAERWLYRNNNNRPMRLDARDKIARDMAAGRFSENGDAIRVSASGDLMDGQHRLEARVASGTSGWMLVVSNLPDTARDTVDDGAKRTMRDRFGFRGESDPGTLAAVVRRALLWERGLRSGTARYQPSALESLEFLDQHPELREASQAASHHRRAKLLAPSTIGLCWWLFSRLDEGQCEAQCAEFFDRLSDGAMLAKGNPILTLRNRLVDLNSQPGRVPEIHPTALTIKSWNAYREGREITLLKFAENEKFPTPK
ncbi:hypothetical protein ACIBCT_20860 [Streptosporangium sp. NPDC050855]|uniref:hypothetical protein n=1 Tax=Streptosporangium sp. NPDC050855 TaxID=3366194 RepID=UPI0037BA2C81